jgi:hypothetical protein
VINRFKVSVSSFVANLAGEREEWKNLKQKEKLQLYG